MRRPARLRTLGISILLIVLVVGAGALTAQRAVAEGDESGGNLSVTVTDGIEPTPTESPTPTPSAPPESNPGGPQPGDIDQETITDPDEADEALGDDPAAIGGIMYMSGITATTSPSFSPTNGIVTLTFTVRNTSSTTFDSTARFWITTVAGNRIAEKKGVRLDGLAPGETRRVSATFGSLWQHTVLKGNVTLTPPKTVEGTKLSPITRDALIVLPPLFGLAVGGGAAALLGLLLWLLGPHGLGLIRFLGVVRVST